MIFGEVGKGIHQYRIYDIAIVDLLGIVLLAYVISLTFKKKNSFIIIFLIILLVGIIVHHLLGVRTTLDKLIF